MRNALITLVALVSAAIQLPGQQTYLSKEYIHLGARTIAVENYLNLNTQTAVDVTQSNPWYVVASADLNRDGVPDLVWQQYPSSGWVQVWFMGGANGTVLSSATNIATTPYKVVAAADFNRDGTPDLLLQDPATGKVYIWYLQVAGNPPTVSIQSTAVVTTNAWNVLAAADFNGDGHPDLVWQNPTGGSVQIWYMTGSQGITFSSAAAVTASTPLHVAATTDFNGDGVPDLVMQDPATGLLQVWFMTGSTSGTVASITTVTSSNPWRVKAAATNGLPYFIWESPTTGWVQYWFMNVL
jgi:FG-GAP-like repeat